ncbi:MAG TPA: peptidylprolyl isomerase [Candidatus Babeliales bacterium]|nr:peptidylprolyl isomerase [Candidatus Babeliales bacterium]
MLNKNLWWLWLFSCSNLIVGAQLVELDKIEAIVNGQPITTKYISRRGYDGEVYQLTDLIDFYLADQLGERLKVDVSDDMINRYVQNLGMTLQDLSNVAAHWNYPDINEFKSDLKMMYRGKTAMQYELDAKMVISEDEIAEYYRAHPVTTEVRYVMRTAFVPQAADKDVQAQQAELEQLIQKYSTNYERTAWDWDPVVEVLASEISASNSFLFKLEPGEMYVKPVPSGFDIFVMMQVIPAGVVPLEKRRNEIVKILTEQRYPAIAAAAKQELREQADIVYPK